MLKSVVQRLMDKRPAFHSQRPTEIGGGGGKGRTRDTLSSLLCVVSRCFFIVRWHCLDSMSERLSRIISNTFMVSVDTLFDECKHVATPLIDHAYMNN